jgi:hypothetical protein
MKFSPRRCKRSKESPRVSALCLRFGFNIGQLPDGISEGRTLKMNGRGFINNAGSRKRLARLRSVGCLAQPHYDSNTHTTTALWGF